MVSSNDAFAPPSRVMAMTFACAADNRLLLLQSPLRQSRGGHDSTGTNKLRIDQGLPSLSRWFLRKSGEGFMDFLSSSVCRLLQQTSAGVRDLGIGYRLVPS